MYTGTVTINTSSWLVDIATSYSERAAGLGGLASIPVSTGMLFVFSTEQPISVTTYPMLFNLDIIFLDSDFTVIGIERNVVPNRIIPGSGQYFLEMNAGEAVNVQVGDQAQVSELPPIDDHDPFWVLQPALILFAMMAVVVRGFSAVREIG